MHVQKEGGGRYFCTLLPSSMHHLQEKMFDRVLIMAQTTRVDMTGREVSPADRTCKYIVLGDMEVSVVAQI